MSWPPRSAARATASMLLWAIAVGAFFKFVLNEGIARWQLATGKTALEGWAEYLPAWVKCYFGVYLVFWTVFVTRRADQRDGPRHRNLTQGRIPQSWGGVLHSLFGFVFVLLGGYGGFEKLMKTLVGVMGFSILVCAALTFHDPAGVVQGTFIPIDSVGRGALRAVDHRRHRRLGDDALVQLLDARREDVGARAARIRARRHRDRVSVHGAFRHGDHDDREPGVLRARRGDHERAGCAEDGGDARQHSRRVRTVSRTRVGSGRRSSRRCSACGRACRISMRTSTAS